MPLTVFDDMFLQEGDVFTIDRDQYGLPVHELDAVTRQSTGRLKQFVVTPGRIARGK